MTNGEGCGRTYESGIRKRKWRREVKSFYVGDSNGTVHRSPFPFHSEVVCQSYGKY